MNEHTVQTSTHGRYLVEPPDGAGPFPVLMGFHGYAESAIVVAGFSQGAAQAYRAGLAFGDACAGIIALGGDLPPDVAPEAHRLPPVLVGRGRTDSWYTAERLATDVTALGAAGQAPTVCEFDGGHEWAEGFVASATSWLAARRPGT